MQVEVDVVAQHAQKDVSTDALFDAVANRADVKVGVNAPEGPLDVRQGLLARGHLCGCKHLLVDGRAENAEPAESGF